MEPPRDKTNNVAVCPAKTQISLGIRPVWSVFTVRFFQAQQPSFQLNKNTYPQFQLIAWPHGYYQRPYRILQTWTKSKQNLTLLLQEQKWARSWESAFWSVPLFSLLRYYNIYTSFIQSFKTLTSFWSWAGRLESCLVANTRRQVFSFCGSDLLCIDINEKEWSKDTADPKSHCTS